MRKTRGFRKSKKGYAGVEEETRRPYGPQIPVEAAVVALILVLAVGKK